MPDIINKTVQINKLVDWKNPPTVEQLKNDLTEAKQSHSSHVKNIDVWTEALQGKNNIKATKGRSQVQPKLIRKQNEWRYPALEEPFLSTDDLFTVNPVTALDVDAARQNELILNKQFRVDIPKVKFINKYIRTAVDKGTVILKVGWKVETAFMREQVEVPIYASPEESLAIIQAQLQSGEIDENTAQQMLQAGQPIQTGIDYETQLVEKEIVNSPVVEIRDSRNVVIDPSCEGDIDKAQFIVDMFTTDLSTLKKDGRYKNLQAIIPTDSTPIADDHYTSNTNDITFSFKDKPRQKLVVYEYWGYWDINNTGIVEPIVAAFVNNIMIRLEKNPYPDKKLPFVIISYSPVTDSIYGESDAALLIDNQAIIGAVTRGMLDLLGRSANSQMAIRKDAVDTVNYAKLKNGEDFEYNAHIADPSKLFYINKYPEIPRSAIELITMQSNEAESMTGVKAFTGGITGQALGNNVGGIRSALDATAKRELGILRRLSQGLVDLGKKIIAMNSVWLSDEEIIRITDDEFVAIKRDDLAGNFDLSLTVSTAESDNQKASELAFMLQTLGNSMPMDITKMILVDIANLRKMPLLAKNIDEYEPQPDPIAQEKAMLEIELLKAQIANEQAKAQENAVDVALKTAKTAVEEAKAGKLGSDKDMTDLAFMEQMSGVKQERELEKTVFSKQKDNQNT